MKSHHCPLTLLAVLMILLGATLVAFERTYWDLLVQDLLYDFSEQQWLIPRNAALPRALFYHSMKFGVIAVGMASLVLLATRSRFLQRLLPHCRHPRKAVLGVVLSIILIPLFIGFLKQNTDIYYPSKIDRYGGTKPYYHLFEPRPPGREATDRGHGFPAGHASGGFALLSLVFIVPPALLSRTAAAAIIYGSMMALYQTLNGAHYLSHSIVTLLIALIIIVLIGWALRLDPVFVRPEISSDSD